MTATSSSSVREREKRTEIKGGGIDPENGEGQDSLLDPAF